MVFVASNPNTEPQRPDGRLWAFPARCGTNGASCSPEWVADFPGASPLDEAPTVADGMVFVTDGFVQLPGVLRSMPSASTVATTVGPVRLDGRLPSR